MNIKERFLKVKDELDNNAKLKKNTEAEVWDRTPLKEGFILNDGVEPSLLKEFEERCPVEIPKLLKKIWVTCNGFAGSWGYEYEYRKGDFTTEYFKFGLMPMEEAFGGLDYIESMCDRMENDALLQWVLLDIDNFEDNADITYNNTEGMNFDRFEDIVRNSVFLEYFSEDLYSWTILKLDAKPDEPCIYISYNQGESLLPVKLNLEEYIDKMFETKGVICPWPLLYVDRENLHPNLIKDIEEKEEKALKFAEDVGFNLDLTKQ